jgi:hypothetical protein
MDFVANARRSFVVSANVQVQFTCPGTPDDEVFYLGGNAVLSGGTFNSVHVSIEDQLNVVYPDVNKNLQLSNQLLIFPIPVRGGESMFLTSDGNGVVQLYFFVASAE